MKKIEYMIFIPGGNNTALVKGLNYTLQEMKIINDEIMKVEPLVEQVGFLGNEEKPELIMAGGEFCGNATRSAAYYYLNGIDGEINITVNSKDVISAGVKNNKAWCNVPIYVSEDSVTLLEKDIYKVKMNGMICVVVKDSVAKEMLYNSSDLKKKTNEMIKKYNLEESEAVGIMYLEGNLKINPVVWVKSINTLFCETACGSGTTATVMVETYLNKQSTQLEILQPSGYTIIADVTFDNNIIQKAVISGVVIYDNSKKTLLINI